MKDSIDKGVIGLIITYVIMLPDSLNSAIRAIAFMENKMVSVERCHAFTQLPNEKPYEQPDDKKLEDWPDKGSIEFIDATLRYRPTTPVVLDKLNFLIKPKEKVGIAGRTGSGKSTITQALFRIVELESGKILIDGIDISQVGLMTLRQKMCIIPQDPVLFIGNLRYNIDPFGIIEPQRIKSVLDEIELTGKFVLQEGEDILDKQIEEKGGNLSVGERQLICIARAIVKQSSILIMDEATASIDFKTDQIIQQVIKKQFQDRTVLTIAHRLNTIINTDRILVLEKGRILDFDSFNNLKNKEGSIFNSFKFNE